MTTAIHLSSNLVRPAEGVLRREGLIPKLADADSCCVRPSETSNCRNARKYNGISAPCPHADDGAHESTSPQASIIHPLPRPRLSANSAAQALTPPLFFINVVSGWRGFLTRATYRSALD